MLGIFGAALGMLADIATGYSPSVSFSFRSILNFAYTDSYALLTPKNHTALMIGNYLAVLGIPFGIFGILQIYNAIKPAGKKLSTIFLLVGVYIFIIGSVFHASLALLAIILQMGEIGDSQARILMYRANDFVIPVGMMLYIAIAIASIISFYAVYFKQTHYPRWVAFFNPLFLQLIFASLSLILNSPYNQLSFIMIYNASALISFFFSTAVLANITPARAKRVVAEKYYPQILALRAAKPLRRALQYYFAEE